MSRQHGALGLVVTAALVASALFASVAHAEEKTPTFTGGVGLARETGSQVEQQQITVNAGTLKCKQATLLDNSGNGGMMLVTEPSYAECTVGTLAATVKMNGCGYTFEPTETLAEDKYVGRMGIVCSEKNEIEVITTACTVTVGPQINLKSVEFVNNTGAEPAQDETWRTEIKGGKYTQKGALCPGGAGTFENLSYAGSSTVKGDNALGEPVNLWIGES